MLSREAVSAAELRSAFEHAYSSSFPSWHWLVSSKPSSVVSEATLSADNTLVAGLVGLEQERCQSCRRTDLQACMPWTDTLGMAMLTVAGSVKVSEFRQT